MATTATHEIADIINPDTDEPMTVECQWFAGCGRPAAQAVSHPVLEWVPACGHCIDWVKSMDA